VQAFSIDDSQTTEIDDALSVQGLGSGTVTVGIHIAAPGLAIAPDSAIDAVARARLSTVYMPGHKITMLPDEVVQTYTLLEGAPRPALSLYVQFNEATLEVVGESQTALEQVPIAHNLRHDQIDHLVSAEWLQGQAPALDDATLQPLQAPLGFLFRLAQHLKAQREVVRGKPETFNRPDFTFKLDGVGDAGPQGTETVRLGTRRRGAPLDLIVAEAMILANSHWGQWLARCGVPGIYRSQASLAPGVKVRMGAKALPHAGIGVPAYAWSTSPLRRYVDLVNQWQIMACVRNGPTAALVAPFKPKDAQLFGVISAFDTAYTAYNQFQNGMERYWTLQHIRQAGITELDATVIKDGGLVRADTLPLVFPVMGADNVARGSRVRVRLGAMDDISMEVGGTVIGVIGAVGDTAETPDGDEDEDNALAAPVALAIDLNEASTEAGSGEAA
jgi:exoribonuclease-2